LPAEQDVPCVQPNDRLPANHFARLVAELVDEHLDLVRIRGPDDEARGGPPPYDPRLMAILLYAYTTGVCSSRMIERKCVDDAAFRWRPPARPRAIERSPISASSTCLRSDT